MSIEAFIASRAIAVFGEPVAFRHTPEVVLVEEFACIPLFTKATEPVLADG